MDAEGPCFENQYIEIHWSTAHERQDEVHTAKTLVNGGCTFIVSPRILVRPVHELLVYPSKEADGRIRQVVPERLWLRVLLQSVARALLVELRRLLQILLRVFVEAEDSVSAQVE